MQINKNLYIEVIGYYRTVFSSATHAMMIKSISENENSALETKMKGDEPHMQEEGEAFLHTMEVGGIGSVRALIDSGSNDCVIRRELLTDPIMSKMKPTEAKGTLYDGSGMDILGSINLSVRFLDMKFQIPFYVVVGLSDPMVLGTNWIRYSGAILQSDGTKIVVTFGGKKQKEGCGPDCSSPYVSVEVDGIGTFKRRTPGPFKRRTTRPFKRRTPTSLSFQVSSLSFQVSSRAFKFERGK